MGSFQIMSLKELQSSAAEAALLLKALANERRLLILCRLTNCGEATVGSLVEFSSISQPAVSQHLARMREEGLVDFRRDGHTLLYRIADERVAALFSTLEGLFCRQAKRNSDADARNRPGSGKGATRSRRRGPH
jgi:ArsR family transcriptional regulator